ncbi:MAG: ABC transporter permease [Prevotellaceae bacterium]|jgi:putative ABC transport system permease protein|nr:ABC transporter permease [Prevotellaceae bacterium]
MIKNFLFVLKRFKTSSVINIVGLSVALVVFFVVLMQVYYDFTYDRSYANVNKIVQLNSFRSEGGKSSIGTASNFQLPAQIKDRLPEVEAYCMFANWGNESFDVDKGNAAPETYPLPQIRTTQSFLKVFTPEILAGDTTAIFAAPGKAMISEKTAQRLFGSENPVGKSLRYHYSGEQLTVQAVYRDFPENSSLKNGVYTHLQEFEESEWSFLAFFLIQPGNLAAAREKINSKEILGEETSQYLEEHPELVYRRQLSSPNDLYLSGTNGGGNRINTTLSLLAIGILTLLIAFINFVNLSLAMAPSRVRSITIRRVMGANRTALRASIAAESVLFTALAAGTAFAGIHLLRGSAFAQELFPTIEFSLLSHVGLFASALGAILLLAFAIGLYTMRYTTSFGETEALKGSFALGVQGVKMRNLLIVVQFTAAIALICISIFIRRQNDYMLNFDWGMPKKNIVYLPIAGLGKNSQSFGQELLRDPRISDYCITRFLPGRVGMNWGCDFEGKNIQLTVWSVDDRFFDFFEVEILAGRKPEHTDSVVSQIVVNEVFLRKYEFDESIVGKDFSAFGPGRLQAVAKDVHFQSLRDSIAPMAFGVLSKWQNFAYVLVKLTGSEIPNTINHIEQVWKQFSSEPFEVHFLDESMDQLYQKESNMAKLIGLFGLIIVVIAVMGVYGLILFNTKYREREIAIRKVNGSSNREIMLLLNRAILAQLGVAFAVAVPVAYYVVLKWLESFAYKTQIVWWVFLLGGAIVLAITLLTVSAQSYKAASRNPTKALNNG